jgi:hypothetical protein
MHCVNVTEQYHIMKGPLCESKLLVCYRIRSVCRVEIIFGVYTLVLVNRFYVTPKTNAFLSTERLSDSRSHSDGEFNTRQTRLSCDVACALRTLVASRRTTSSFDMQLSAPTPTSV